MKYLFFVSLFLALSCQTSIAQSKKQQPPETATLKLYPTTAKTYVNVYVEWPQAQPFRMAIYDAAGVLIKEWEEGPNQHYQKTIFVSEMADGNYTLHVTDKKKGVMTADFVVAK